MSLWVPLRLVVSGDRTEVEDHCFYLAAHLRFDLVGAQGLDGDFATLQLKVSKSLNQPLPKHERLVNLRNDITTEGLCLEKSRRNWPIAPGGKL